MIKFQNINFRYNWLLIVVLFSLFVPLISYGQDPFVDCAGLSCDLEDLLNVPVRIYNFMMGIAATVFLVVIIWAGIRMTTHHMSESTEAELTSAKTTLTRGIT
jgi:hypothetical protein